MITDIEGGFKNSNNLVRGTIVKSFKYSGSKETDTMHLEFVIGDIINLIKDKDLKVKKNALESLTCISHHHHGIIKSELNDLMPAIF